MRGRRLVAAYFIALVLGGCEAPIVSTQEDGRAPLESGGFRQWTLSGTYKGERVETYLFVRTQGGGGKLRVCGAVYYDDTPANIIHWPELLKDVNSYIEIKGEGSQGSVRVNTATFAQFWHHFGTGPLQGPTPKIVAHCVKTDVDWQDAWATAPLAMHFQTTAFNTFPVLRRGLLP
jgi:hypothetical protein